ncbi:hypothetical protein DWX11_06610 [Ruminococcus sp. AF18-29]|uniref:hypothetical protein n=1 Tax=Ruminococcus bicirculans (ex Wegman et al. 2014) TaxID=1160721 RepID=UPI000E4C1DD5|nr:hypothetical protein DWX11_06610 [Ruminococcus sp. AF18-29]
MGRNQNQNSNQGISDDDIDNILGGIKDWIGNVDTKISFLLTVSCIFLGFIIENDIVIYGKLESCSSYWWIVALLTLSLILSIISIMLFIAALKATNKHPLVNYKSVIFAGDIASNSSFDEYNRKLSRITENELQNDKKKQIYINANIYNQKVKTYNSGLWVTIATMVVYVIYKILSVEMGL